MTAPTSHTIDFELLSTVLTSPHGLALTTGEDTHEPALKLVGQLVSRTIDDSFITKIARSLLPENYGGNTLDEIEGMIESARKKGFDEKKTSAAGKDAKVSQAHLEAIKQLNPDLFHDSGNAYISIPQKGGGTITHPIRSQAVQQWLRLQYFERTGKPIGRDALNEVIDTLEAIAIYRRPAKQTNLRVASANDIVFVDLGQEIADVVEISREGYRVVRESSAHFRRPPGFGVLPLPATSGNLLRLKQLLGFNDANWVRFLAYLICCLNPKGPYFILLVTGEQGSGKSLVCTAIKRIIDPNVVQKLRLPATERDLMIQAHENWLLVYDNTSSVKADISDGLCSLSTGSGFSTRRLYTDDQSQTFASTRPIAINGIGEFANRPDLLERSVRLELPSMPEEHRKTEREIWSEFETMLPEVLAGLFTIVAHALSQLDIVEAPRSIRMSDAAHWLVAAEPATGLAPGSFVQAIKADQEDMMLERVINDPIVLAVLEIIKRNKTYAERRRFDGTVGELHQKLLDVVERPNRFFPATPAHLSNALQRLAPAMVKIGVIVEFGPKTRKGKPITIRIEGEEIPGPDLPSQRHF